jgi:putative transposase
VVEYRHSAHAVTDLKYHVIWVTKYRYKILRGDIAERARELLRQICVAREVTIIRGAVSPDHIHLLVAAPPQLSPSKLVQFMKGRSSRLLQQEFPALRKRYWGQHLWGTGLLRERRRGRRKDDPRIY